MKITTKPSFFASLFRSLLLIPLTVLLLGIPSQQASTAGATIYLPYISNITADPNDVVLIAAGDIAKCDFPGDEQTAALVNGIPGTILALGDNAYDNGTAKEYASCYDPSWGAFKNRTRPVAGNHEYLTDGASGYFDYFGAAAGNSSKGYYSYDLGTWHILAINSNCSQVGGCGIHTLQETWVKEDLANSQAKCTLAYWHHPFYSSGETGNTPQMFTIWQDLYKAGAEIVLSGHEHNYERFAPQDQWGALNRSQGVVQFVVGTGGGNFTPLTKPLRSNSAASIEDVYGVLKLTLHTDSYNWEFLSIDGKTLDSGLGNCH